ncbi:hypothetical protein [Deinococcus pimensis]|uniref:hypothetical protein n=1 Tax=Deinococcus pimensis TaxID=309888 RepID=UPI000488B777|nr:hypothetical protein [Deinococcus pimensis]
MTAEREPELDEYADLENIWTQVQHGPHELRAAVYRLLGPELERWGLVREEDLPSDTRRPVLAQLQREQA